MTLKFLYSEATQLFLRISYSTIYTLNEQE